MIKAKPEHETATPAEPSELRENVDFPGVRDSFVAGGKMPDARVLTGFATSEDQGEVPLRGNPQEWSKDGKAISSPSWVEECRSLTKMELRKRYPREATCHRHMKGRAARRSGLIHRDFKDIRDFLLRVGPMPASGATLDRIDNNDPEYAPGKVRWADKCTQNNNKRDTRIFIDAATGEAVTASELGKRKGMTASAIRKRSERGWSASQISIPKSKGRRRATAPEFENRRKATPVSGLIYGPLVQSAWLRSMTSKFPGECTVLTPSERGMLTQFATLCSEALIGGERAEEVLECTIKNWTKFARRSEDEQGAYNCPSRPTPAFLIKYPRVAINLWLRENRLEIKDCMLQERSEMITPVDTRTYGLNGVYENPVWLVQGPLPPEPAPPKMTLEEIFADPDDD